jgi:hypothetical protein
MTKKKYKFQISATVYPSDDGTGPELTTDQAAELRHKIRTACTEYAIENVPGWIDDTIFIKVAENMIKSGVLR